MIESLTPQVLILFTDGPKQVHAKTTSDNVQEGQAVQFFCSGKGNPDLTFNWSHNGKHLSNKANWTIQSINDSQGGRYSCTAQNKHGRQTSNTTINVQCEYFLFNLNF